MQTFPVDDVTPVTDALPTRPTADLFPGALATGGDARVLKPNGVHPLLHAVAQAFAEHRPLVLSPDAVWLTIARGISEHVKLHAEELRPALVGHEGKKALRVEYGPADTWEQIVEGLAKQVGDPLFECDFSTSTEVERLAGRIALLDTYSPFHGYWMISICGIPSITLTGTPDDWRRIRARVDDLPRFGLDHWRRSLAPIADEFVRAADGEADRAFWQRVYNPVDAYGGELVTGWITRFYPYLDLSGGGLEPNPMLDLPLGDPRDRTDLGISTASVPATLCRAVIGEVAVDAGLVGVTQHDNGALEPVAGWAVSSAPVDLAAALDRVVAEHESTPPRPVEEVVELGANKIVLRHQVQGSGELISLYGQLGTASLHGGTWRVPAYAEARGERIGRHLARPVLEHVDGRVVGEVYDFPSGLVRWVLFRPGDVPRDVPVLGASLALVLLSVLEHDDVGHLETQSLAELLP
ncbi:DUF4419 domain-containing protein [Lentzea sp. NPDC003310]|uniref:DUF4419 domain-containing protein n=1 Tax=Lentzea sp. NPDC003310 TaxID=3154447 RepID=UPI0033A1FA9A